MEPPTLLITPHPESKHRRLLVVDDEAVMIQLLALVLRADGHSLTLATNGADALACFQLHEFDLVITDKNMPGMDGEALAAEIKRRNPEMPILLISGHLSPTLDTSKFDRVLAKPFTRDELRAAIEALT